MANFFDDVASGPTTVPAARNFFDDVAGGPVSVPSAADPRLQSSTYFPPAAANDPLTQSLQMHAAQTVNRNPMARAYQGSTPDTPLNVIPDDTQPAGMSEGQIATRKLAEGTQDVGHGIAHLIGMPGQAVNATLNMGLLGADKVASIFGGNVPFRMPVDQGERLATGLDNITSKVVPPSVLPAWNDRTLAEKLVGNAVDMGTQGLGMGTALTAAAPLAQGATGAARAILAPYFENAPAAVAADAVSGVGSGVGHTVAQTVAPGNPLLDTVMTLAGAGTGAGTANAGRMGADMATTAVMKRLDDTGMPRDASGNMLINPETNKPFSRAEVEAAARPLQQTAGAQTNLAGQKVNSPEQITAAKENIDTNLNALRTQGVPASATPTSGLMSENPGLVSAEGAARTKDGVPFINRDQAVKGEAADRVASLSNPAATPEDVPANVQGRIDDLKETRDAEALPILKKAEASGAVVDPQPVADLIDSTLSSAKRPAVITALTAARKLLNQTGADTLDTSVSGLYEARKGINDIIAGRDPNTPTGRYAQKELLDVRDALDKQLTAASPEFGQYMSKYKEGSEPLDAFGPGTPAAGLLGKDPREVAKGILGAEFDGPKQMEAATNIVGKDPAAMANWKEAVSQALIRRVTNTKEAGEGGYEVAFNALAKQFKDNKDTLTKVFSPAEMNTLQQAHTLLGFFKQAEKRATVGSNTADKESQMFKSVQLAIRHVHGDLEGGGIIRRMRLFMSLMPNNADAVSQLTHMAWFNPEVASYLLGKNVRDFKAAPTNTFVKRAIALSAGGNDTGD